MSGYESDTCGRSYTIRIRYVWTQIFLYPHKKVCGYKNLRIRMDGASVVKWRHHANRLLKRNDMLWWNFISCSINKLINNYVPQTQKCGWSFENKICATRQWNLTNSILLLIQDDPIMTEEEALRLLSLAATLIQAHVRGYLVRKKFDFFLYRRQKNAATCIQAAWWEKKINGYNFFARAFCFVMYRIHPPLLLLIVLQFFITRLLFFAWIASSWSITHCHF